MTGISSASMIELPEKYWKYNGGGHYAHRMTFFHIAVPIIPFEKIDEIGAGMYKGEKRKISDIDN